MGKEIHPTSIISPGAEIAEDTYIGPFCIIHDKVRLGKGSRLISNVIIEGATEIGENCTVYPFTSIGLPPQDMKYKGKKVGAIGDVGCFSFCQSKTFTTGGEGGCVITDDEEIAWICRSFRDHGYDVAERLRLLELEAKRNRT